MADPFVAEIRIFPFNFAPKGWAWCNGQLMPISQNTALFSLLGTTYGGDGKSTFALPDLQGSAPIHAGQGQGLSLYDLGQSGGTETVTLLTTEMPSHPHQMSVSSQLGLENQVAIEKADPTDPNDSLRKQNPIGKIPALIREDGTVLYDSPVILEYLDHRAGGGRIVPNDAGARFHALRLQALADGVMDASVLLIYEGRWRPAERHEPKWVDHQAGKVARTLAALEAAPPALTATPDVGQIALACALGYRDFRFEGTCRRDHPRLVAWLDEFAARVPAFAATTPQG